MIRADALNSHVYPVRTEMTDPSSHVCSTDESELKEFLINKNLSQSFSTDKDESKGIIVKKILQRKANTNQKASSSTNVLRRNTNQNALLTKKDAKNEVKNDVLRYFNIFKCGINLLNRLDVSYERVCMATPRYE